MQLQAHSVAILKHNTFKAISSTILPIFLVTGIGDSKICEFYRSVGFYSGDEDRH